MRTIRQLPTTRALELFAAFFSDLARADLRPLTISGYGHDLQDFITWFEAAPSPAGGGIEELTSMDLVAYRQHLVKERRLKAATVNRRIQALRRFCKWAAHKGHMKEDPSREIKTVRVTRRRRPKGLTEKEAHALLRAAGRSTHGLAKRNYALVQLLLQTGLRVGEVAALELGDITVKDRSGFVRVQGKGLKEREVPLNATARRALREYLESRIYDEPNPFLFISSRSSPMSVRSIQTVVTNLARRACITRLPVTPHTARHTFALSYLKQNQGKLVELASLLGHDSLDTTALYCAPAMEDLAEDLEASPLNIYG